MKPIGPFDEPIPTERLKQVAAVVPKLELRDLRLVRVSAGLKAAPSAKAETTVNLGHKVETERIANGAALSVTVHFQLKASGHEEEHEYFRLNAGFHLSYSVDASEDVDDEQLRNFGEINAVHTAWPYFRELVQNTASRMGLGQMTVPLLKLGQPARIEPSAQQASAKNAVQATGLPGQSPSKPRRQAKR